MPSIDPQLLQIALDKGLLALIVAGMAFFLSKRLERFKAKNTYFQRLSEKRLEAYQNLILLLNTHLDYIQNLTIDIELRRGLHSQGKPYDLEAAHKLVQDYLDWVMRELPKVKHALIFSSGNLFSLVSDHLSQIHDFNGALLCPSPESDPLDALRHQAQNTARSLSQIHHHAQKELYEDPFP